MLKPIVGKLYRVKLKFWNNIENKNITQYGSHIFMPGEIIMLTKLRRILPEEDSAVFVPDHLKYADLLYVVFLAGKKSVETAFYDTTETFDDLLEEVIV